MTKEPTAIICLSNKIGGMELDALKLSTVLHDRVPLVTVIKKGSILEERTKSNPDFSELTIVPIAFNTNFFSPSLIFTLRSKLQENGIKNVIFLVLLS